jgi:hypothetical protein
MPNAVAICKERKVTRYDQGVMFYSGDLVVQSQQVTLCLQQISYCSYKGGEGGRGGGRGLHFMIRIEKMVSRLDLQVKTS